jgi:hypothetical protein
MTNDHQSKLPNYRWIKFNLDHLDDPVFMQLPLATKGFYLLAYLIAGEADAEGLLCSHRKVFDIDDLAWKLREDAKAVKANIDELTEAGLVVDDDPGFKIANFLEEQGPGDDAQRGQWRTRQQKHRARARKEEAEESELTKNSKEVGENRTEQTRESRGHHGDVTVTGESDSLLSSPFFSSLGDNSKALIRDINNIINDGLLKEHQAKYFLERLNQHGEAKVISYLKWCAGGGFDWPKAIATDKKNDSIANWKVEGHITAEDFNSTYVE